MSERLPTIFLWADSTGNPNHWGGIDVIGRAMAEDGTYLGSHLCSSPGFAKIDMQRGGHLHDYESHYPDGYCMEWLDAPAVDPRWQLALDRNKAMADEAQE